MRTAAATILTVDDEDLVRKVLGEYLSRIGYRVLEAGDGPAALEIMRQEKPDLVLTDFAMAPMDGLELLERVKSEHPDVAVIFFTGASSEELIIKAFKAGASDFIKKPFTLDKVKAVVYDALQCKPVPGLERINLQALTFEHKRLEIRSRPELIPGAIAQMLLSAPRILSEARVRDAAAALYEVINNAVEYGNLEISAEEKAQALESGAYRALLDQKTTDPELGTRKVVLESVLDAAGLNFVIRGQGRGFDVESIRPGGDRGLAPGQERGLLLAALYADRLEFNEHGLEARLTMFKRLDPCGGEDG